MTYESVQCYQRVNGVEKVIVNEIKESIIKNGWKGSPILVFKDLGMLITGSHRMAALDELYNDDDLDLVLLTDLAQFEDVSDIINKYCEDEECSIDEIDFGNLRPIFENTRIEKYKNQIEEW